jgi:hypothetical protein
MFDTVLQASKSDAQLVMLLGEAREYAQIYLLAKDRKKGCEGTGELMTLREEFRDAVDKMVRSCPVSKETICPALAIMILTPCLFCL